MLLMKYDVPHVRILTHCDSYMTSHDVPFLHTTCSQVYMLRQLNVITQHCCTYISMLPGHLMQHVRRLMFELITAALCLAYIVFPVIVYRLP